MYLWSFNQKIIRHCCVMCILARLQQKKMFDSRWACNRHFEWWSNESKSQMCLIGPHTQYVCILAKMCMTRIPVKMFRLFNSHDSIQSRTYTCVCGISIRAYSDNRLYIYIYICGSSITTKIPNYTKNHYTNYQ